MEPQSLTDPARVVYELPERIARQRPPLSPRRLFALGITFLVASPILWIPGKLLFDWYKDQAAGPLRLYSAVLATSPDGKTRFEADTDGTMRLVETHTGHVIHTSHISLEKYRRIEAEWLYNPTAREGWYDGRLDGNIVLVKAHTRYSFLMGYTVFFWNRESGRLGD